MARKKRFGLPLWLWIFGWMALLLLLTLGAAYLVVSQLDSKPTGGGVDERLAGHLAVHNAFQQQRYQQLRMVARIFSTDPALTRYIVEAVEASDGRKVLDLVEEYQNRLHFDLAVVLDRNKRTLIRTDDPDLAGEDYSGNPLLDVALREDQAFGVWAHEGRMFDTLAVPLARDFDFIGYMLVGFAIDDAFYRQLKRSDQLDTVFLSSMAAGPRVLASTLSPAESDQLMPALRLAGDALSRTLERGERVDGIELELDEQQRTGLLIPLHDAVEQPIGGLLALTSPTGRSAVGDLQRVLLLLGGLGLICALLSALLISRRTLAPVRQLVAVAQQARASHYDLALPASAEGEVGRLADSLSDLLSDLREKEALGSLVSHVSRHLPEPSKSEVIQRPRVKNAALLAVEMRRFANPKLGYDPEESVDRLSRDLQRIGSAVAAHRGRPEAVFGHRVLASFEGDDAALQALAAATEVVLLLTERENVFDDPQPPLVAMTSGPVVSGSANWGDRQTSAVLGLPMQQLESLLREATPGDLLLSAAIYGELAPAFQRAEVTINPQRGLVSTQALYLVSAEIAGRVTGVQSAQPLESPLGGDARSMAEIAPGVLLGNRFEVLAQLGAGRSAVVYKVRDRETHDYLTLKMLRPEVLVDPLRMQRLKSQILQARGIQHPNVQTILDFAEVDGLPFVATAYVRGVNLRYLLDQSSRLPLLAALQLARRMTAGLAAAHQEKVLHLGLKPENVLVEPSGNPQWMDFGLAVPQNIAGGEVVGSPYYLAPEQIQSREPGAHTDLYSLGVMFYEMFTGELPFTAGSPAEIFAKHVGEQPAALSSLSDEVGPDLEQLVLHCLAKAAADRPRAAHEVLERLDQIRL